MSGTLADCISGALTEIGQLGQGQTMSPEDAALGLRLANLELSKASSLRLYLFNVATRTYALVANTHDYTIGPTGSLGGAQVRPTFVESAQINVVGSSWLPLSVLDKQKWDAIVGKGAVADFPEVCWPDYSFPNIGLHVNPAPSGTPNIRLGCWEQLTQFVSIFDVVGTAFPPEYEEWIEAKLAIRMAAFYDQPITDSMASRANEATQAVMSQNAQGLVGALAAMSQFQSPNLGQPIPTGPAPTPGAAQ